ncbi:MAG: DUF87 domain-containing protein [Verrucomicrobiota bacterium]
MKPEPDITIGEREGWGDQQSFGISVPDQRHHLYIIGKTGSGKTTLLRNLIIQHIAQGHGVGVIDPHGDLAEELLHHVPPKRAEHLCYFNPGDLEFPIGLNVLANVAPDDRHLVASGIVGAFKGIWRDSWGPRLEYNRFNAAITRRIHGGVHFFHGTALFQRSTEHTPSNYFDYLWNRL